jgi:hypothetical protein
MTRGGVTPWPPDRDVDRLRGNAHRLGAEGTGHPLELTGGFAVGLLGQPTGFIGLDVNSRSARPVSTTLGRGRRRGIHEILSHDPDGADAAWSQGDLLSVFCPRRWAGPDRGAAIGRSTTGTAATATWTPQSGWLMSLIFWPPAGCDPTSRAASAQLAFARAQGFSGLDPQHPVGTAPVPATLGLGHRGGIPETLRPFGRRSEPAQGQRRRSRGGRSEKCIGWRMPEPW